MPKTESFENFVARKTQEATGALIPGYVTEEDNSAAVQLTTLGNSWTYSLFDGPFYCSAARAADLPAINLVFVQSKNENTGALNPESLGGGATDKHLIYEGLSRIRVDGVLAGAGTAGAGQIVFSIWHPELVKLRQEMGKPRHPVQILLSGSGRLAIESGMMFNQREVPVVILTSDEGRNALARSTSSRPWIRLVCSDKNAELKQGLQILRNELGISAVSAVGGRTVATALLDRGIIQDIYLTTSAQAGGDPYTPYYTGNQKIEKRLVLRKLGREKEAGVVFEHFVVDGLQR